MHQIVPKFIGCNHVSPCRQAAARWGRLLLIGALLMLAPAAMASEQIMPDIRSPAPLILKGSPKAVGNSSIMIGNHLVDLYGVVARNEGRVLGLSGIRDTREAASLSLLMMRHGVGLRPHGGKVFCTHVEGRYVYRCTLPDGSDLGLLALEHGLGRATEDAPEEYREAARIAKSEWRGIYQPHLH